MAIGKGNSAGSVESNVCSAFSPPVEVPTTTISNAINYSNSEFRVSSSEFRVLSSEFRVPSSESVSYISGFKQPIYVHLKTVTRNSKLGTRNSELETRNSKLETRNL